MRLQYLGGLNNHLIPGAVYRLDWQDTPEFQKHWSKELPLMAEWSLAEVRAGHQVLVDEMSAKYPANPMTMKSDDKLIKDYEQNYRIKLI